MTLKEKIAEVYPECVSLRYDGGVNGCPGNYGILNDFTSSANCGSKGSEKCTECWNREYYGKPTIKDSGDRREFSTGAVRDMAEGKGRMDLLPWAAIIEVSKHCENGAKKYGDTP